MRLLIDSLVALMLAGVLAGVIVASRDDERMEQRVQAASSELWRLKEEVMLQAALQRDGLASVPPKEIDPRWFHQDPPRNPLLEDDRPWIDIARGVERTLEHPVDKAALDRNAALFWYNPSTGALRARVPLQVSDADTLELYNRVNGTALTRLYGEER
ncbi:MAG: hypothetical protein KDA22_00310 [Phycisphaerales bacterium]|nr:hypothetical protein [Phycisphaerales bacterium]